MNADSQRQVRQRLARIEGQVRGLMHMVDEERTCVDVLTQVAALRAALDSVGSMVLSSHVDELAGSSGADREKLLSLQIIIERFLK